MQTTGVVENINKHCLQHIKGEIFLNIKSNVLKSVFAAGFALTGLAAISLGTSSQADAATVGESVKVDYNGGQSVAVWSNYYSANVTGSAVNGSTYTVQKTAHDASGNKWYKIGSGQWILAKYTSDVASTASTYASYQTYKTTNSNSSAAMNNAYSYSYTTNSSANTSSNSTYTTNTSSSSSESEAKAWIASRESGGSYSASNGNYYGKYQLSKSYLNGDYSAANQEKAADSYVASRYGSWSAAKSFWEANGWY